MRARTKILAIAGIAAALTMSSINAFATSTYISWTANLPSLQQGVDASHQVKTVKSTPANFNVTTVGSDYTVNARFCKVTYFNPDDGSETEACGTEKKGLGDHSSANLSNTYVDAGTTGFLNLHNNTWTVVRVSATGNWRAN
jgi:hypothetical protein